MQTFQQLLEQVNQLPKNAGTYIDTRMLDCINENHEKHVYASWSDEVTGAFTICDFYKAVDRWDKFGDEWCVLYFRDQPVYVIHKYGRYRVDHTKYIINPELHRAVQQHFNDAYMAYEKEMGIYYPEQTAEEMYNESEILRTLDIQQLPISITITDGPRDILMAIADANSSSAK